MRRPFGPFQKPNIYLRSALIVNCQECSFWGLGAWLFDDVGHKIYDFVVLNFAKSIDSPKNHDRPCKALSA